MGPDLASFTSGLCWAQGIHPPSREPWAFQAPSAQTSQSLPRISKVFCILPRAAKSSDLLSRVWVLPREPRNLIHHFLPQPRAAGGSACELSYPATRQVSRIPQRQEARRSTSPFLPAHRPCGWTQSLAALTESWPPAWRGWRRRRGNTRHEPPQKYLGPKARETGHWWPRPLSAGGRRDPRKRAPGPCSSGLSHPSRTRAGGASEVGPTLGLEVERLSTESQLGSDGGWIRGRPAKATGVANARFP